MKKFFTIIGFVSLVIVSFMCTEKVANMFIDKDELMMTIKEVSSDYEVNAVDGVIENNTFIPGINGIKVNNKESYNEMKKYGIFNDNLLKFDKIEPKNKLNQNYDKYIISGNKIKNEVTLIFLIYKDTNIDNILKILDEKKVKANFFVDGYWFENHNNDVINLINKGHVVGNLSYNLNYNDGAFIWMDTIIKRIGKQRQGYCYAEKENESNLQACSLNKNFTIKPNIIVKDNYTKNVKNDLVSGSIISFNITKQLEEELPIIINHINSKGYSIENLNKFLKEEK